MSVSVSYKGSIITTLTEGQTKTLDTEGTWLEDNITITDTTALRTYYTGDSAPAAALGVNGDIYFQTSGV